MRFGAAHRKLWGSVSCLAVLLGLLVAGCGGGSSPPPGGVTVAINPTIVRVVVTGTQQFAANVTGTASAATIAASNGAVRASNIVTITTTSPHGLTQGQTVVISGVTATSFNGTSLIADRRERHQRWRDRFVVRGQGQGGKHRGQHQERHRGCQY